MAHIIYALVDPRDQKEFYIGRTEDLYRRFSEHMKCADRNDAKNARVLELKSLHLLPIPKTLEVIEDAAHAALREAYWIRHFRTLGYEITNDVVYSTYEQEGGEIIPLDSSLVHRRKLTETAKKIKRLLRKDRTIGPTELASKCGCSKSYASEVKRTFLREQPA